jgi:hypothetical protein
MDHNEFKLKADFCKPFAKFVGQVEQQIKAEQFKKKVDLKHSNKQQVEVEVAEERIKYEVKMSRKGKLMYHQNLYDSSRTEFYLGMIDGLENCFDIIFDQELYSAPLKLVRLQKRLAVDEQWKEFDID